MCFSVQQLKKRFNGVEQAVSIEESTSSTEVDGASSPPASLSSARRSFQSRVRAIQNARRFLLCNPKLRSSHPSYGSRDRDSKCARDSGLLLLPLGGSARSACELDASSMDVGSTYFNLHMDQTSANRHSPMPLPSPCFTSRQLNAYRLPLPTASANGTLTHGHRLDRAVLPSSSTELGVSAPTFFNKTSSSTSTIAIIQIPNCDNSPLSSTVPSKSQVQIGRNPVLSSSTQMQSSITVAAFRDSELLPLPPPKHISAAPLLRRFRYDELASACQNFSVDRCFDSSDACFYGAIMIQANGKAIAHEDVVVVKPKEAEQQALQHWLSRLSIVARELCEQPHVCKLVGFYGRDGCMENMLVYEKLRKGSLCTMLFEQLETPPLDWSTRIKIAYGAAQGLASLHERFPDEVLYKDFRASSIQVDADYTSKISGYRPVGTLRAEMETRQRNPRINAYRAPETLSLGELTQKSNVWSFGVILLELLSGRQNLDERSPTTSEKHNLVKWAKPFLIDEGKLFLLMDPKLQGRFPVRGAKIVADLAMLCLHTNPAMRPTMREAVSRVQHVYEIGYLPCTRTKASSSRLVPSVGTFTKAILTDEQGSSRQRSSPSFDVIQNPPLRPLTIPPRCCSEDIAHDYPAVPLTRVEF